MPRPMRPDGAKPLGVLSRPAGLIGEPDALGPDEDGCEKLERKAERSAGVLIISIVDAPSSSPGLASVGVLELGSRLTVVICTAGSGWWEGVEDAGIGLLDGFIWTGWFSLGGLVERL